jgi:hypothetical protein
MSVKIGLDDQRRIYASEFLVLRVTHDELIRQIHQRPVRHLARLKATVGHARKR